MNRVGLGIKVGFYIVLSIGAITMIIPFLWMVFTSIKQPHEVFSATGAIKFLPEHFFWRDTVINGEKIRAWWGNYPDAWREINFFRLYLSSIFVAVVGTFGQVLTSSMAAYAFARLSFPGRDKLFFGYLATMMIPSSVTMIPVFVIMKHLGWINTYQALIIPGLFSAYGTFMLRQFFMGLPVELEDAAKIDGSGYIGIWSGIILPLAKPALATLTTFTFMGFWGSYMWPLVVTVTEAPRTLPIGLRYFVGQHATNYTQLMAASVIALIPVLLLFVFNQRYFVEGIKLQGLKG
ncbi:MAG: carbohydrate ABC transporter permease [Armatimonadetes bacterium]|nr:carbohydrate ABC transporter permease [Armatimonadota bacterium]